jgi:hypothetical protein
VAARPGPGADLDLPSIQLPTIHRGGSPASRNPRSTRSNSSCASPITLLDIVRGDDETVLRRIAWPEIHGLEVPSARRFRRRAQDALLIVRVEYGDGNFEIPGAASDQVRRHLAPIFERFSDAVTAARTAPRIRFR